MSRDSFLTRWSWRKAAAKAEPQPQPVREEEQPPESQPQPSSEQPGDEVDLSSLPPLDSITSETDITAFLKRGVPEALRTAALRKAWINDPAIRDFVGLSENAWDFTNPAGIPGFGPIDFSPEQVRQMAAELVGSVRDITEQAGRVLDPSVAQQDDPEKEKLQNTEIEEANSSAAAIAPQQDEPAALQKTASTGVQPRARPRARGSALPH